MIPIENTVDEWLFFNKSLNKCKCIKDFLKYVVNNFKTELNNNEIKQFNKGVYDTTALGKYLNELWEQIKDKLKNSTIVDYVNDMLQRYFKLRPSSINVVESLRPNISIINYYNWLNMNDKYKS